MAVKLSTAIRNAKLDAVETTIGSGAFLGVLIYTGSPPATAEAALTGTRLAIILVPTDYFNAAASGSKTKLGTWQTDAGGAIATGTAGYFRFCTSSDSFVTISGHHLQGTCGMSGSGADLILDNTSIVAGQQVTATTFTLNEGNG